MTKNVTNIYGNKSHSDVINKKVKFTLTFYGSIRQYYFQNVASDVIKTFYETTGWRTLLEITILNFFKYRHYLHLLMSESLSLDHARFTMLKTRFTKYIAK